MKPDRRIILHDLHDQHEWACAYAAVETFIHTDGIGLYGTQQALTYTYGGKGGEWTLTVWRNSEGVQCARAVEADDEPDPVEAMEQHLENMGVPT